MITPITLYDIRTTPDSDPILPLSPYTWRTRYALNIKGLSHKTEWILFHEVPSVIKEVGVQPGEDGKFTVPTIIDPVTKRAVMDSAAITEYLDAQYPDTPALLPAETRKAQLEFVDATVMRIFTTLSPSMVFKLYCKLDQKNQVIFRASKEKILGKRLEDIAPTGAALVEMLKQLETALDRATRAITERNGESALFFGGNRPVFADTALAGVFTTARIFEDDHEITKLILTANGGRWARYRDAFEKWMTVI